MGDECTGEFSSMMICAMFGCMSSAWASEMKMPLRQTAISAKMPAQSTCRISSGMPDPQELHCCILMTESNHPGDLLSSLRTIMLKDASERALE